MAEDLLWGNLEESQNSPAVPTNNRSNRKNSLRRSNNRANRSGNSTPASTFTPGFTPTDNSPAGHNQPPLFQPQPQTVAFTPATAVQPLPQEPSNQPPPAFKPAQPENIPILPLPTNPVPTHPPVQQLPETTINDVTIPEPQPQVASNLSHPGSNQTSDSFAMIENSDIPQTQMTESAVSVQAENPPPTNNPETSPGQNFNQNESLFQNTTISSGGQAMPPTPNPEVIPENSAVNLGNLQPITEQTDHTVSTMPNSISVGQIGLNGRNVSGNSGQISSATEPNLNAMLQQDPPNTSYQPQVVQPIQELNQMQPPVSQMQPVVSHMQPTVGQMQPAVSQMTNFPTTSAGVSQNNQMPPRPASSQPGSYYGQPMRPNSTTSGPYDPYMRPNSQMNPYSTMASQMPPQSQTVFDPRLVQNATPFGQMGMMGGMNPMMNPMLSMMMNPMLLQAQMQAQMQQVQQQQQEEYNRKLQEYQKKKEAFERHKLYKEAQKAKANRSRQSSHAPTPRTQRSRTKQPDFNQTFSRVSKSNQSNLPSSTSLQNNLTSSNIEALQQDPESEEEEAGNQMASNYFPLTTSMTDLRGTKKAKHSTPNRRLREQQEKLRQQIPPKQRRQRRNTPPRYALATCTVKFGPSGQLIKIPVNSKTSAVKGFNNSVQLIKPKLNFKRFSNFSDTELLEKYPGPLKEKQTHKQEVIRFCEWRAAACLKTEINPFRFQEDLDENVDKHSKSLLWKLLALMIRQNGQIVGHDVAELLLEGYQMGQKLAKLETKTETLNLNDNNDQTSQGKKKEGPSSIHESEFSITNDPTLSMNKINHTEQDVEILNKYRDLLMYGRQTDALEWAIDNKLWGHALVLSSRINTGVHAEVSISC